MDIPEIDKSFNPPDFEIEALARCLLPGIQRFFESEEGQREFQEWKANRESENG